MAPPHNAQNKKGKWNEETTLDIGCGFDAVGCLFQAGGHVLTTSHDTQNFDK
jgi:hypothetical protein